MREMGEERNWALAAYALFLIAPASSGVTALIGVILAHVRLDTARGGLYGSGAFAGTFGYFFVVSMKSATILSITPIAHGLKSLISVSSFGSDRKLNSRIDGGPGGTPGSATNR